MIRKIITHPAHRLRQVSVPVKDEDVQNLSKLMWDLKDTLRASGGVGLAAPQINVHRRVIVALVKPPAAGAKPQPTFFINPVIVSHGDETIESQEACLSVPGKTGIVDRFKEIVVEYKEPTGENRKAILLDFEATVLQHEIDHLDGILYIDKIKETKSAT